MHNSILQTTPSCDSHYMMQNTIYQVRWSLSCVFFYSRVVMIFLKSRIKQIVLSRSSSMDPMVIIVKGNELNWIGRGSHWECHFLHTHTYNNSKRCSYNILVVIWYIGHKKSQNRIYMIVAKNIYGFPWVYNYHLVIYI